MPVIPELRKQSIRPYKPGQAGARMPFARGRARVRPCSPDQTGFTLKTAAPSLSRAPEWDSRRSAGSTRAADPGLSFRAAASPTPAAITRAARIADRRFPLCPALFRYCATAAHGWISPASEPGRLARPIHRRGRAGARHAGPSSRNDDRSPSPRAISAATRWWMQTAMPRQQIVGKSNRHRRLSRPNPDRALCQWGWES